MSIVIFILSAAPPLLLVADFVRWKIVVWRTLSRHGFVLVRSLQCVWLPAGRGVRLIESCVCKRNGKKYKVVVMNLGWFRRHLLFEVVEL